jgi:hypothetical protein
MPVPFLTAGPVIQEQCVYGYFTSSALPQSHKLLLWKFASPHLHMGTITRHNLSVAAPGFEMCEWA